MELSEMTVLVLLTLIGVFSGYLMGTRRADSPVKPIFSGKPYHDQEGDLFLDELPGDEEETEKRVSTI